MSRGQRIAVHRETVVAFLGATPRGPVSIPVAIRSVKEYMARFGSPDSPDQFRYLLAQFFDNGGTRAIVVRVSQCSRYSRVSLAGPSGPLILDAINPGPWESLRGSVDYDHIPDSATDSFNLVIHRMTSLNVRLVEEQEIFSAVSINPDDSNYVGHALLNSGLVRVNGLPPVERPTNTLPLGAAAAAFYVYAETEWKPHETLTDYDLVGSDSEGTGLFALDLLAVLDLVCIIPERGKEVGPVALFMADRYCRKRNALLLIDPPSQWTSVESVLTSSREREFCSPNVITYFPRLAYDSQQNHLPCTSAIGAIAGSLAAEDVLDGIFVDKRQDPISLHCQAGLELNLSAAECAVLERNGVNVLQMGRSRHISMNGLVTFMPSTELDAGWRGLRKRRAAMFIVESIARATRWAAFEENAEPTWAEIRRQVESFLQEIYGGGCSAVIAKASHYVVCDSDNNRAFSENGKKVRPKSITFFVGFALQGAGFSAFRFVQDAFECQVEELGWQPGIALAS